MCIHCYSIIISDAAWQYQAERIEDNFSWFAAARCRSCNVKKLVTSERGSLGEPVTGY